MAWYSLYLWFSPWRKTPYRNMIHWYKLYLHEQWFNSLSDEDKKKVVAYRERKKREDQIRIQQVLMALGMASMYSRCEFKYDEKKPGMTMEDIFR